MFCFTAYIIGHTRCSMKGAEHSNQKEIFCQRVRDLRRLGLHSSGATETD